MFISIENVFFSYDSVEDGQPVKNAVDGVSLTVEQGEFVAVIGHNGCGKSTLAKHLNAMLLPDSGKVYVEPSALKISESRQRKSARESTRRSKLSVCTSTVCTRRISFRADRSSA